MKQNDGLSAWQLAMLALGTVVGGSFFLGSSIAIRAAGPASLLSFILGVWYALLARAVIEKPTGTTSSFYPPRPYTLWSRLPRQHPEVY